MILTVYTTACASCGRYRAQINNLRKMLWQRPDVQLRIKNIRIDEEAKEQYYEALEPTRTDAPMPIVVNDSGRWLYLSDVTQDDISGLLQ